MMAAAVNANANAAVSPRPSSGAARTSSPPWDQIARGPEAEGLVAPPPLSESPVTIVLPPPAAAEAVYEQISGQGKSVSSPEGSDAETPENDNGSKKPAWSKPYNAAPESGLVMGAVSWPTLSESKKAPSKMPSADSSKNLNDGPIFVPQVTAANASSSSSSSSSSAPQKQMTSNPKNSNPNATQHHGRPARQRSMKREGGGNSSANGGFPHQFSQSSSVGDSSHTNKNGSGTSDSSGRDHGHNNATKDGGQRSGGDYSQQRNYRRSNSGPHSRGDGSFGGRRGHDRGNNDWNHHRSFNGRDPIMPPQSVGPRGFIRPPPPGAIPYVPTPIRPYGNPMGISPEMQPLYFYAPRPGLPFIAPPAVYYRPPDPQLHFKIINQIDYYFSNENLIKDTYLRKNMDESGWVPIQLIANFKKVMQLTTDIQLILDAVRASTVVEIQGDKIRKRDDWMRWIMPPTAQFPTAAGSQSPRMLQNSLPDRVRGLALEEKTSDYSSGSKVDAHAGILLGSSSRDLNGQSENSNDGRSSSGC